MITKRSGPTRSRDQAERRRRVWAEQFVAPPSAAPEARHAHEDGFLACVESGLLELESDLGAWTIFPDTVTYVPPRFPHSTSAMSDVSGFILHVPAARAAHLPARPHVVAMSELFMSLCRRIVTWDTSRPMTAPERRILAVAMDELAAAKEGDAFRVPLPKQDRLLRIARTILASPEDMSGLDRLAKIAGMSRRSFTRHFAEETGLSFVAWRQRTKLHAGLRMLSSGVSVTEVALALGYRSTSAFISMFRRRVGFSPTRYFRDAVTG